MKIKELKDSGLLLFECISGSKAYGLATEKSDTDIKGVFYLPKNMFFGLNYIPQISNETNDEVYYELGRFVELLIKSNPNVLEILVAPPETIIYKHPIMDRLKPELILSRRCKDTFGGYALTQIRKASGLNKKMLNPMPKKRKRIIDFCYVTQSSSSKKATTWLTAQKLVPQQCGLSKITNATGLYALFYDFNNELKYKGIANKENANDVSVSSIPKGEKEIAYLFFNQDSYSSYCKAHSEYWEWVEKRNEDRYDLNQNHGKNYDSKNMMHTIRLLQVALEIISEGKLNVKRKNRDELLAIKNGELSYDEILALAEQLTVQLGMAEKNSPLPNQPDQQKIEATLIGMREELYKNTN